MAWSIAASQAPDTTPQPPKVVKTTIIRKVETRVIARPNPALTRVICQIEELQIGVTVTKNPGINTVI